MTNYFMDVYSAFENAMVTGLFTDGILLAFGCAGITVISIWSIMRPSLSKYYMPISWLMIFVSMSLLSLTFIFDGWISAASFTAAYGLFLLAAPVLIFIIGIDAACAVVMATPILSIELLILIAVNKFMNFSV
jgi:hypothetical protein